MSNDSGYIVACYEYVEDPDPQIEMVLSILSQCAWITNIVVLVASVISFAISVSSWILITKWRSYKNYLFSNFAFACAAASVGSFMRSPEITSVARQFRYFRYAVPCWIFLISLALYKEIVIDCNIKVRKKYVITNIFGWGLPFVFQMISAAYYTHYNEHVYFSQFLIIIVSVILIVQLFVNIIVFSKVLYALFTGLDPQRRFKIKAAVLIFLMYNYYFIMLLFYLLLFVLDTNNAMTVDQKKRFDIFTFSMIILSHFQMCVVIILFLAMRSNRLVLWEKIRSILGYAGYEYCNPSDNLKQQEV